jgi:hypothetical protein
MGLQRLGCGYYRVLWRSGAPEEIRTPDPQIRRLLRVIVLTTLYCKNSGFNSV